MSETTSTSSNNYGKAAIISVAGFVVLTALLWLGELIANARSEDAFGLVDQGGLGSMLPWVAAGAVVVFILYAFFADSEMFTISTREVVMMGLGASLYGVTSLIFNTIPVPSVSLISLRPVVAIPIFFGFVFGPTVGFFVGAFGNVLGDALTGWGVFPVWDIGNGIMGLIPGLAGMYLSGSSRGRAKTLLWISAAVIAVVGIIYPLVNPDIIGPFSGELTNMRPWYIVGIVVLAIVLLLGLAPKVWPYVLILLTAAFVAFGIVELIQNGFGNGVVIVWVIAAALAWAAYAVNQKSDTLTEWLEDDDTTTLVAFGTIGIIVGIGFAAISDIFISGYSLGTALIGEFLPAALPNIIFAVILTPLLYAAWKQARAQTGR